MHCHTHSLHDALPIGSSPQTSASRLKPAAGGSRNPGCRLRHLPITNIHAALRWSSTAQCPARPCSPPVARRRQAPRSEEHTSELQSLMRISYAVFCLKYTTLNIQATNITTNTT